jgi:hypothetical protein
MKSQIKLSATFAISVMALTLLFLSGSCKKGIDDTATPATTTDKPSGVISLIGLKTDSGFAYKIGYDLVEIGDSPDHPAISTLRLFENGVELGPAHSNHADIRKYGQGQFSHWGNTLYFSSSDNTDPLKNGRKYTYTMK